MTKKRNGPPSNRDLGDRVARLERGGGIGGGSSIDPAFAAATNAALAALDGRLDVVEAAPHERVYEILIGDGATSLFPVTHGLGNMHPDFDGWDITTVPNIHLSGMDYLPIDLNNGALSFQGYVPTFEQFRFEFKSPT